MFMMRNARTRRAASEGAGWQEHRHLIGLKSVTGPRSWPWQNSLQEARSAAAMRVSSVRME